jgi:nitrite reductase/ring-hydroxylating ferredoxin subunit
VHSDPADADSIELADLREGRLNVKVLRSGRKVVVVKRGDDIKVFDELCPHMGGDMSEATYCERAGTLQCKWHGYIYGVDDGRFRENPNERLTKVLRAPTPHFRPEKTPSYRLRLVPFTIKGSTVYVGGDDRS